jgi:hypothetical protein
VAQADDTSQKRMLAAAAVAASGAGLAGTMPKVMEYMSHLDNVIKAAKTLGWTGFGLKEAADVYKAVKELTK